MNYWRRASCASDSPLSRLHCSLTVPAAQTSCQSVDVGFLQLLFLSFFGDLAGWFIAFFFCAADVRRTFSHVFTPSEACLCPDKIATSSASSCRLPVFEGEAAPQFARAAFCGAQLDVCTDFPSGHRPKKSKNVGTTEHQLKNTHQKPRKSTKNSVKPPKTHSTTLSNRSQARRHKKKPKTWPTTREHNPAQQRRAR